MADDIVTEPPVTKKRGRRPSGERAMTPAERQRKRRAAIRDTAPVTKTRVELSALIQAIAAEWDLDDVRSYRPDDGWRLQRYLPAAIERLHELAAAHQIVSGVFIQLQGSRRDMAAVMEAAIRRDPLRSNRLQASLRLMQAATDVCSKLT